MTDVNTRINVNTATIEELEPISGIGPALARGIVARRDESGPFANVDALTAVKGIGPSLVGKIRDIVTVSDNNHWQPATRMASILPDELSDSYEEPMEDVMESLSESVEDALEEAEVVEPVLEWDLEPAAEEIDLPGDADEISASQALEEALEAELMAVDEEAEPVVEEVEDLDAEILDEAEEVEDLTAEILDEAEAIGEDMTVEIEPELAPEPVVAAADIPRSTAEEEYRLPPPLEIIEPSKGRLTFWKGLLLTLLGALLGGALAIGAVWLVNGTLDFGSRGQVYTLQGDVAQMRADRDSLERQIGDLEERLNLMQSDMHSLPQIRSDIEQVGERAGELRAEVTGVQGDLGALRDDLGVLQGSLVGLDEQIGVVDGRVDEIGTQFTGMIERVDVIQGEMDTIADKAERFDVFLGGLRALLQDTAPAE